LLTSEFSSLLRPKLILTLNPNQIGLMSRFLKLGLFLFNFFTSFFPLMISKVAIRCGCYTFRQSGNSN